MWINLSPICLSHNRVLLMVIDVLYLYFNTTLLLFYSICFHQHCLVLSEKGQKH